MVYMDYIKKIEELNVCIIIPTYNNERTLKRVIEGVLGYSNNLIVVNDGSTDTTKDILNSYTGIEVLHLPKNRGKGVALRTGFRYAIEKGYDFAITIDSDGQHYPDDIPVFINYLERTDNRDVLLIGARNMNQEGVPGKSSFGNKFSNFWFWFETGVKLQDTQSGYRLYPLHIIKNRKFFTTKFEFEIEVIVKLAWLGVHVINVPVKVLYDPAERVSHFRPFKDFTRISILNTLLVTITLLYILPRKVFLNLKKKGIRRFFMEDFLGSYDSPRKKALSIALGIFIGLSPFWGFHTVLVIFLAVFFNLNKPIAFAFSNVSLPPFIPFVLYAGLKTGHYMLGISEMPSMDEIGLNPALTEHLGSYIIGSFTLALLVAVLAGTIGYLFFSVLGRRRKILPENG